MTYQICTDLKQLRREFLRDYKLFNREEQALKQLKSQKNVKCIAKMVLLSIKTLLTDQEIDLEEKELNQ